MTPDRQKELETDPRARLTVEERKAGWHYCDEFDFLLTQGEILQADEVTCICGFDPRKVEVSG